MAVNKQPSMDFNSMLEGMSNLKGKGSKGFEQILDKATKWTSEVDPKLDQLRKFVREDLKKLKGEVKTPFENIFKKELNEMGIWGKAQKEHIDLLRAEWIKKSPELAGMDNFISHLENLPKLKKAIQSAEPMDRWEAMVKGFAATYLGLESGIDEYFGPVLSALGLDFLVSKKKGETDEAKGKKAEKGKKGEEPKEGEETEVAQENQETLEKPKSTLFIGDSNSVNLSTVAQKALSIDGTSQTIAKERESSQGALSKIQKTLSGNPEAFKGMENAVILLGTNEVLGSPEEVKTNLQSIYEVLKKAGVKNIYAVTIPPFKGYARYDAKPEANTNRHTINEWIRTTTSTGLTHRVIDLCRTESEGGLASDSDQEKLGEKAKSGDGVHFSKTRLAAIYQRELEEGTKKQPNA